MMAEAETLPSGEEAAPAWGVFGDLMSGLLGAFVLLFVAVLGVQLELVSSLEEEVARREQEQTRREALESALAGPLASGRVTLADGRIGISGSVLFAHNSAALQTEGHELLSSLAAPLQIYLSSHAEILMVSGFTDDRPVLDSNRRFADNWDLSAQRALTVTRALIAAGLPAANVFAAAFGPEQPIASNDDEAGRARNRRVEIAPIPRQSGAATLGQGRAGEQAAVAGAVPAAQAAPTSSAQSSGPEQTVQVGAAAAAQELAP